MIIAAVVDEDLVVVLLLRHGLQAGPVLVPKPTPGIGTDIKNSYFEGRGQFPGPQYTNTPSSIYLLYLHLKKKNI